MGKADENTKQFDCGAVLHAYEGAWSFVYGGLGFFAILGAYVFWDMLQEVSWIGKIDNSLLLLFCVWRMHRCRDVLCYVTEKGLVVRRRAESFRDYWQMQVQESSAYVFVEYEYIVAFRSTWREIEVGSVREGGIAVILVELSLLSKKDKNQLMQDVQKRKEKN